MGIKLNDYDFSANPERIPFFTVDIFFSFQKGGNARESLRPAVLNQQMC